MKSQLAESRQEVDAALCDRQTDRQTHPLGGERVVATGGDGADGDELSMSLRNCGKCELVGSYITSRPSITPASPLPLA